jgi:hypothetical protein
MIKAYEQGVPNNGEAFPEGSVVAKIAWSKKATPESPYPVNVPGTVKSVGFAEKARPKHSNRLARMPPSQGTSATGATSL